MSESRHLFVYGLLTFPEIVQAVTGKQYQTQPALLREHRRYGLSQSPLSAAVPILVEETAAVTEGVLLLDVSDADFVRLDHFEEIDSGHYLRKTVRVESNGQWYSADVYLAGPILRPYACGEWFPGQVSAEQRQHFVTTVIPEMLKTI